MTTILREVTSEGERRCDARCQNAEGPRCDCVCGGQYHGLGMEMALEVLRADVALGSWSEQLTEQARRLLAKGEPMAGGEER